jgi:starvation-inducible DNA-binding protein
MNKIGIAPEVSKALAEHLNILLANYQVLYMNTHGFHWNIKGGNFFELHEKFEELYNDLFVKIDEIAERILTLGHTPLHSYSDYLEVATITSTKNISDGNASVASILDAYAIIIPIQREILQLAGDSQDEGTSALMSDYIREQEKTVWMYSAYLNR